MIKKHFYVAPGAKTLEMALEDRFLQDTNRTTDDSGFRENANVNDQSNNDMWHWMDNN